MAYTHLTMKELGWVETYYEIGYKATEITKNLDGPINPFITLSTSCRKAELSASTMHVTKINQIVAQRIRH